MAKLEWNKVNQPNGIEWGSRPSSDVRRSKKLKEIYETQQINVGKYKKSYVQRTYENCPFDTNDAFEESIRKSIREEQDKELNGNVINGYIKLTGGKYRHFNYKDVWDADSDYILWLFWNTPHEFIRSQILKSVPISDNLDLYFTKVEMPSVNKLPTQPTWWHY
jgi:hypothetical protein